MTTVVLGVYPDLASADSGIAELTKAGFARDTISVILKGTPEHEQLVHDETDDTPRGLLSGVISGGALASLAFGALALPGIGVIAAGPVLAALTAGAAGAMAGGVLGAMVGHGLSTQVAQEYESELHAGRVLLAVHTVHDKARAAQRVLTSTHATHISDATHFATGTEHNAAE
jgi:outer membrane lipoprotein SlyB